MNNLIEIDPEELQPRGGHPITQAGEGRRVLEIVLEIELTDRKVFAARLNEAYRMAVIAAVKAVGAALLPGSVDHVESTMSYGYRHLEGRPVYWVEALDGPDKDFSQRD